MEGSLAGATAPARGLFLWNVEYYPEPRKPGRGAYWSLRGLKDGAEEGEEEAEGPSQGAVPQEPRGRLVPGLGYIKE